MLRCRSFVVSHIARSWLFSCLNVTYTCKYTSLLNRSVPSQVKLMGRVLCRPEVQINNNVLYYIILNYIILYYIILYYIILYYVILYYIIYIILYYNILYYIILCYIIICLLFSSILYYITLLAYK